MQVVEVGQKGEKDVGTGEITGLFYILYKGGHLFVYGSG